jgi:2-polyprenyl-3-methyl-5-hydroxy-6-metoxy-1,4-benzoquinol methylase
MDLIENNHPIKPESHWYYQEKFRHIYQSLINHAPKFSILCDIGAGTAPFSKQLALIFPDKNFIAVDKYYSDVMIGKEIGGITHQRHVAPADVYLLTDVLEHIEKPKQILEEIVGKSNQGALLIISVPAHMILWSGHDVFLKHYRRYTRKNLLKELSCLDYELIELKYIFNILFIPVLMFRTITRKRITSNMKQHNFLMQAIFRIVLKFDVLFKNKFPFGLSVYCVIRLK